MTKTKRMLSAVLCFALCLSTLAVFSSAKAVVVTNWSNVNTDLLGLPSTGGTLDLSQLSSPGAPTEIRIPTNIDSVTIIGTLATEFDGLYITAADRSDPLTVVLRTIRFKAPNGYSAVDIARNQANNMVSFYGSVTVTGGEDGAGIRCASGTRLAVSAANRSQVLNVNASGHGAAIGGAEAEPGGTMNIIGGTIIAKSITGAAVGGGASSASTGGYSGKINIEDCDLTAWAKEGVCIGGGDSAGTGGAADITISGGCNIKVATEDNKNVAIGHGYHGTSATVVMTGGTIEPVMLQAAIPGDPNATPPIPDIPPVYWYGTLFSETGTTVYLAGTRLFGAYPITNALSGGTFTGRVIPVSMPPLNSATQREKGFLTGPEQDLVADTPDQTKALDPDGTLSSSIIKAPIAALNFTYTPGTLTSARAYAIYNYGKSNSSKAIYLSPIVSPNSNAELVSLTVKPGKRVQTADNTILDFDPGVYDYDVIEIPDETKTLQVTPTSRDGATITVNGVSVGSGGTTSVTLVNGLNVIEVIVTAQDGKAAAIYTLNANVRITGPSPSASPSPTPNPITNANLASLSVNPGTLDPVFSAGVYYYRVELNNVRSVDVSATTAEKNASLLINNVRVRSGQALNVDVPASGGITVPVTVIAPDGFTRQTYMVVITNEPYSSDANLLSIHSSAGKFSPTFSSGTYEYTLTVPRGYTSVAFSATVSKNAVLRINGAIKRNGELVAVAVKDADKPTEITVDVTAQDSFTTKTYTVLASIQGTIKPEDEEEANKPKIVPHDRFPSLALSLNNTPINSTLTTSFDLLNVKPAVSNRFGEYALTYSAAEVASHKVVRVDLPWVDVDIYKGTRSSGTVEVTVQGINSGVSYTDWQSYKKPIAGPWGVSSNFTDRLIVYRIPLDKRYRAAQLDVLMCNEATKKFYSLPQSWWSVIRVDKDYFVETVRMPAGVIGVVRKR